MLSLMNFQRKAILNCRKAANIFWLLGILEDDKNSACGKIAVNCFHMYIHYFIG